MNMFELLPVSSRGHMLPRRRAVELLLQLPLGLTRKRRLQHRAAVLAQGVDRLVRRDFLDDEEQRGRARLQQVADLLLKLLVDAGLLELAPPRTQAAADGHAEHGPEEQ